MWQCGKWRGILGIWLGVVTGGQGVQWDQFRGPTGQGIALSGSLPLRWGEGDGVVWETLIHGRAWSSPVVGGGRIWVSTATPEGHELYAVAVDAESGSIIYDEELFRVEEPQFAHKFNTYASPTPVIEAGRVYVTFGSPGTACLDTATGKVLWRREDLRCNHYRGAGSSPILYEDLLIMNFDGSDFQYVIALDKETGETRWKTDRSIDFDDWTAEGLPMIEGDLRKAFSTPQIWHAGGRDLLLSIGSKALYAYAPRTGLELWRVESRVSHSASTRPTVSDTKVYYCTGFPRGELWAVDPGWTGAGFAPEVEWKVRRGVPNKPSLILNGGLIYMIDDGGIFTCVEAEDGKLVYQERVGGNYSASPLLWRDRIYCFSEEGKTTVLRTGRKFEVMAVNQLGDGFMASPAVFENSLVLRSRTRLYRITE